jgi:hypothetical protein
MCTGGSGGWALFAGGDEPCVALSFGGSGDWALFVGGDGLCFALRLEVVEVGLCLPKVMDCALL